MSQHLREQWRKIAAMAGPIYRGVVLEVPPEIVQADADQDWDKIIAYVKTEITRLGASHGWHDGGVEMTLGAYWSHSKDVAEQFTGKPTVPNLYKIVITARYDDAAPKGIEVGRDDTGHWGVSGGEQEQTLSPGTTVIVDALDITVPVMVEHPQKAQYGIPDYVGSYKTITVTNLNLRSQAAKTAAEDYWMGHRPTEDGPPAYDLLEGEMMPDDVYDRPDLYTGFRQWLPETMATLRAARGNPNATITIYRAQRTGTGLNTGDWVTLSRAYAAEDLASYDEKNQGGRSLYTYRVPASTVRYAGDDLMEFGYFGSPIGPA